MITEREDIDYALAKKVPDMEWRGFTIQTAYGEIKIDSTHAKKVADVVKTILNNRLAEILSEDGQ